MAGWNRESKRVRKVVTSPPSYLPEGIYYEKNPDWYRWEEYGPGGQPKIQKKPDSNVLGIDFHIDRDGNYLVKCWEKKDHSNLELLLKEYKNCPRIVKSVYKKEFQLRILRMTEYPIGFFLDFYKSWDNFIGVE